MLYNTFDSFLKKNNIGNKFNEFNEFNNSKPLNEGASYAVNLNKKIDALTSAVSKEIKSGNTGVTPNTKKLAAAAKEKDEYIFDTMEEIFDDIVGLAYVLGKQSSDKKFVKLSQDTVNAANEGSLEYSVGDIVHLDDVYPSIQKALDALNDAKEAIEDALSDTDMYDSTSEETYLYRY